MANQTELVQGVSMMSFSLDIPTWRSWESLAINVFNIPEGTNTFALWDSFKKEGNITSVDIFDQRTGDRHSKGRVRFRPPPSSEFWAMGTYTIKLRNRTEVTVRVELKTGDQEGLMDSPVRPGDFSVMKLDVCVLNGEKTFHVMHAFKGSLKGSLDIRRRELSIIFTTNIRDSRSLRNPSLNSEENESLFRLRVKFIQLDKLWASHDPQSKDISLLAILEHPALYFRRLKNLEPTFQSDTNWKEIDAWPRQTALVHNPEALVNQTLITNLYRSGQIVDIGRWNVFRITLSSEAVENGAFTLLHDILSDHNVPVQNDCPFKESFRRPKLVWDWINHSPALNPSSPRSTLGDLEDREYVPLDFPVRYQLEVCISNGWLSEFCMTREFVLKLRDLGEKNARRLLEHVDTEKTTYLNSMKIFDIKVYKGVSDAKIPSYCSFMRSAQVTPTTIYYNTPTVDTSNRIIRRYIEHVDHFLRVRFTDEKSVGRIFSAVGDSQDEIYTRVKRTMANGITVGDRHYEFLAFSNSQFRDHGAYFFAPTLHLTAAHIRAWMGKLSHIRNIAKYAARLGQSFSTTRAFGGCKADIRQIEDITRNGRVFSDGVGKISKFLVSMVAEELNLKTPDGELPSAFQFRLGGCKGLLVVSSDPGHSEVHIRPSQLKFESPHVKLEIIRSSRPSVATLNRQLILVLASRGIPDKAFHKKLKQHLEIVEEAMVNDEKATGMLRKYIDPEQMTLCLAKMIDCGFRRTEEPFVYSMLALWKTWHLKHLKEKAKIVIEKGTCVFGCIDETGILNGYFRGRPLDKEASLPQIFIQVSQPEKRGWSQKVITGICIVARNPSLHPGDIQVVLAVDVPQLRHLRDVVVFPQTGDLDVPGMCSGGDLDGDDYVVIWDQDLVPSKRSWFESPMQQTPKKAPDLDRDVTVDEVSSFFVTYMKNNILPSIARAHLAWADQLPDGIRDDKCIRLARLHSDAVDYNKTGGAAVMTRDLVPSRWPHFMERRGALSKKDYHSKKILGQLYDAVEHVNFVPHLTMPFDSRILECKPELKELSEDLLDYARSLKGDYDAAVRRVMAQYEIPTEFEVWSSWILSHNGSANNYNISEKVGGLAEHLRSGFRQHCYEKMGGRFLEALAPLVVAMYRVTHEDLLTTQEVVKYDDESDYEESDHMDSTAAKTSLISFPWMFSEYLGKIAQGHYDLDAITKLAATKGSRPKGKVYTQAEVMRLTADFTIDGGSGKPKVEIPESENDIVENDIVEEISEDKTTANLSAVDRLIDMIGE
ncbi:unnamed protein product [Penicillium pancosmium]